MTDTEIDPVPDALVQIRPRRSLLYLPAVNDRAMEKAKTLAADILVFDLEDSVAPPKKEAARAALVDRLIGGGYGRRELLIRVNEIGGPWGREDIAAVVEAARGGAAEKSPGLGILLPKVDNEETVRAAESVLEAEGASAEFPIWCMMETPQAILNAQAIAGASPRLAGFVMGLNDLRKDLRARDTGDREAFLMSLELTLLAARAKGLAAIDSVFPDLKNELGLIVQCEQGRDLGFDGKSLIHPSQLGPANGVFSPNEEDIAHARKIIPAYEAATAIGEAVTVVDGLLVEALHVVEARRLLAVVAAIEELDA